MKRRKWIGILASLLILALGSTCASGYEEAVSEADYVTEAWEQASVEEEIFEFQTETSDEQWTDFEDIILDEVVEETLENDLQDVSEDEGLFEEEVEEEDFWADDEDDGELPELETGDNYIVLEGEREGQMGVFQKRYKLVFANDQQPKLIYKLQNSSPDAEIYCEYPNGNSNTGLQTLYIVDEPGAVMNITVSRIGENSEEDLSLTLNVRKMPPIEKIEAANSPDLVGRMPTFAFEDLNINITYEGGETEEWRMYDFSSSCSSDGWFYEDSSLSQPIEDIDNYSGTAYTRLVLHEVDEWSFVASFNVLPYNENDYPLIPTDNSPCTFSWETDKKMFRIKASETDTYEFVGDHVDISVFGVNSGTWGGYNPSSNLGIDYAILEKNREYMVMAVVRRDGSGEPPETVSFRCHHQAKLLDASLEDISQGNLTWRNWGTSIQAVYTYLDPEDGNQQKILRAGIDNPWPKDDFGHYFIMRRNMEPVPGQDDVWKISMEPDLPYDGYGRPEYDPDYIRVFCEGEYTIRNVYIDNSVDAGVGSSTYATVNTALGMVIEAAEQDVLGTVITQETAEKIISALYDDVNNPHLSANLEITQGSDDAQIQIVNGQAGDASVLSLIDASIILRAGMTPLGSILETPDEIELCIKVNNYNENASYSIIRVHNGEAKNLEVFKVERNGTGAMLWFRSSKFSTFAVLKKGGNTGPGNTTPGTNPTAGTPIPEVSIPAVPTQQAEKPKENVTISGTPTLLKPKAAANTKVTVSWKEFRQKSKKAKAIWKKIRKIEVQYSTDPTFRTNTRCKLVGKKKTSLKVKILKKKTYYFRIRYTDGKGGYSRWSKTKKIKIKK